MEADGLFVYGTLRPGGRNHGWLRRTHPEGLCRAFLPGRIWHLPEAGYPAVLAGPEPPAGPPGPGWVVGDFVGYEDEAALENALADLDELEDVAGGLYERLLAEVLLASGHRMLAWTYVFPEVREQTLARVAVELPDGDWEPYLRR